MKKKILIGVFLFIIISGIAIATCTDTDGGDNFYKKGCATENNDMPDCDECHGSMVLYEYSCLAGQETFKAYACPDGCLNGACIKKITCTDSDGGIKYDVKGYAISEGYTHYDKCSGSILEEAYCEDIGGGEQAVSFDFYLCPNGCSDGKCLPYVDPCIGKNCDDSNECTEDRCETGVCKNTPIAGCGSVDCDPKDCNDNNECTKDVCDAKTGKCTNSLISNCGKFDFVKWLEDNKWYILGFGGGGLVLVLLFLAFKKGGLL